MDLPSANCFTGSKDYVAKIVGFSRQDARGLAYRPLADFLNNAWRYSHENDITDVTEEGFLWYYAIHPTLPMSPSQSLSPLKLRGLETTSISSACDGRLIFLRGYPSAERLAFLGHFYQIEPGFWRRHLDFLSPTDGALTQVHQPPSTASRIFQLRIGSIGTWGRFWQPHQHIGHLRRSAADDMKRYRDALAAGHNWQPADSVVRRYILHDKEHFTIEQNVTVLFHNVNNSNSWIVMVFLDCGNDLATSPEGPWLDRKSSRMLPTPKTDPDAMLETMQRSGIGRSAGQDPPIDTRLLQSFSHIHLSYGDSLIAEARAKDPFYLLNELFQQDASCERQILDLIAHKIKNHTIGVDSNMIEADDYKILRSELLHFQSFLEDYVENLQNKIDVIRRRGGTSWSRPVEDHVTQITNSATSLLMEDFEYLLKRANNLLVKIERSISLTMSIAGIEDARRGIEQNTTIFRFTVVASFYIPLSFTTSFFGMNFDELSKGLSLWIFFAASTPVFILSVFCLFIRRSRVERFQRSLSEGISSWTNVTRTPR